MRLRLAFSILGLLLFSALSPCPAQDNSGLTILDFKWSRWQRPLDAEVDFGSAPTPARPPMSDEDKKIVERRYGDLVKSAELRKIERDAANKDVRPVELYNYKIKVQNAGTKAIKILYWEYQVREKADPENVTQRQFVCLANVKANERKGLVGISASPPVSVISAKTLSSDAPKPFEEKAVINRIEYTDGSSWQRADWTPPRARELPTANAPGYIRQIDCLGL
jgi:hypothetical protein